jgi:hypothetical protein
MDASRRSTRRSDEMEDAPHDADQRDDDQKETSEQREFYPSPRSFIAWR